MSAMGQKQTLKRLHPMSALLPKADIGISIVFVQVSDPVKLGVVANLARPGGNIPSASDLSLVSIIPELI